MPYDICVVGLGALGVFYSHVLEKSGKVNVTAVCRSNLALLSEDGIRIHSDALHESQAIWKPYRALASCEAAADRHYDFVVCCFKALSDITTTPELIQQLLIKTDCVVLIQNGIGIECDLLQASPSLTVISACAWVDSTIIDAGRTLRQTGEKARVTLGVHEAPSTNRAAAKASLGLFVDLLSQGGALAEATDNIDGARWRKVLWNASFSTVCTLSRAACAELMSSNILPFTEKALRSIMHEVISVARQANVNSPDLTGDAVDAIIADAVEQYGDHRPNPSMFRPSMLVDLDNGRPIEVEAIVGGVIRKAREVSADTPQLDLIYASLKAIQNTLVKSRSA